MVLVKDFSRPMQIQMICRAVVPRQIEQQLQIIALHREFWHLGVEALQLIQLLFKSLGNVIRPILLLSPGAHFLYLHLIRRPPELFLNGLHLLVQEVLALLLVKLRFNFRLNFILHLQHLQLMVEMPEYGIGPFHQVILFQQLLFPMHFQVHIGRNEVHQESIRLNILDRNRRFGWNIGRLFDDVQGHVFDGVYECAKLIAASLWSLLFQRTHPHPQIRLCFLHMLNSETPFAL